MKSTNEKQLIDPSINLMEKRGCIVSEMYNKLQSLNPWSRNLNVMLAVSQLVKYMFPLFMKTEVLTPCSNKAQESLSRETNLV
jgi:hypothetical protein